MKDGGRMGYPPVSKPQQGTYVKPSVQPINQNRSGKGGQSGTVSGGSSGKQKGY
jgi:hypothetical protein